MRNLLATLLLLSCLTFVWAEDLHSVQAAAYYEGKTVASPSMTSDVTSSGTEAQSAKPKPELNAGVERDGKEQKDKGKTRWKVWKDWPIYLLIIYVGLAIGGYLWVFVDGWRRERKEKYAQRMQKAERYELSNVHRLDLEKPALRNKVLACWADLEKAAQEWYKKQLELWWMQSYATTTAVVSSTLLAAIVSPAQNRPAGAALVAVISVHLAITQGLHKAFKIEQRLIDLKAARHEFLGLHWQMRNRPDGFLRDNGALFLKRAEEIKQKYNAMATASVPTAPGNGSRTGSS